MGPRILEEDLNNLFVAYGHLQTQKPGELKVSRGLGASLAICREVVEMHGGLLECVSDEAQGTLFTMSIPMESNHSGADTVAHVRVHSSVETAGERAVFIALNVVKQGVPAFAIRQEN